MFGDKTAVDSDTYKIYKMLQNCHRMQSLRVASHWRR